MDPLSTLLSVLWTRRKIREFKVVDVTSQHAPLSPTNWPGPTVGDIQWADAVVWPGELRPNPHRI